MPAPMGPGPGLLARDEALQRQRKLAAQRMRSASFSATSANSYSKNKDIAHLDDLPPSGPSQVGFATPQLVPANLHDSENHVDELFMSSDPLFINPQLLDPSFDEMFLGNSSSNTNDLQQTLDDNMLPQEDLSWLNSLPHMKDYPMPVNMSDAPSQIMESLTALPIANAAHDSFNNSIPNFSDQHLNPTDNFEMSNHDLDINSLWQQDSPHHSQQQPNLLPKEPSPRSHLFTPRLRLHILTTISIPTPFTSNKPPHLPSTPELQLYIDAYINHFAKHLPFLHDTLEFTQENASLALSMAAIGALYVFERQHSASIFEISRSCVHVYLESRRERKHDQKTDPEPTPLWLVQTLLLGVIYGLFNEEPLANEIAMAQANAVISLAKSAGLQSPPRNFIPVPGPDNSSIEEKWHYFIKVQERIRTMHVVHIISCLLATGYNVMCSLKNTDIRCGSPCDENLWVAPTAHDWWIVLQKKESDGSLGNAVEGPDFLDCLNRLLSGNTLVGEIPQFTLLTLIYAIHLDIHQRRIEFDHKEAITAVSPGAVTNSTKWLDREKRRVEAILRAWETTWSLSPHASLIPRTQDGSLMSDSIPISSLAHVRLYLDLRKTKECFWKRDFVGMGRELDLLQPQMVFEIQSGSRKQFNELLEAASYAADTISLWEKHSARWTLQATATQTFIHNLLALFDCGLLVSEFFHRLEKRDRNTWHEDEKQLVSRLRKIMFRVFDVLSSRAELDVLHNQQLRTGTQSRDSPTSFYDSAGATSDHNEHHRPQNQNGDAGHHRNNSSSAARNGSISGVAGLGGLGAGGSLDFGFLQQKDLQVPLSLMALNAVSRILATIYIWPCKYHFSILFLFLFSEY